MDIGQVYGRRHRDFVPRCERAAVVKDSASDANRPDIAGAAAPHRAERTCAGGGRAAPACAVPLCDSSAFAHGPQLAAACAPQLGVAAARRRCRRLRKALAIRGEQQLADWNADGAAVAKAKQRAATTGRWAKQADDLATNRGREGFPGAAAKVKQGAAGAARPRLAAAYKHRAQVDARSDRSDLPALTIPGGDAQSNGTACDAVSAIQVGLLLTVEALWDRAGGVIVAGLGWFVSAAG